MVITPCIRVLIGRCYVAPELKLHLPAVPTARSIEYTSIDLFRLSIFIHTKINQYDTGRKNNGGFENRHAREG